MTKSQSYYYEDVVFQLELNLQNIRRDLIKLLEEYRFNECFECNRLTCCCTSQSSFQSTTLSIASTDSACPYDRDHSMDAFYNVAPPPETLPTPIWPENKPTNVHHTKNEEKPPQITITSLNIWVKASIPNITQSNSRVYFPVPKKVLDQANYAWPPFPNSIWSDERLKETTEREDRFSNQSDGDSNSSVEEFFRYFGNRAVSKTAFAC